MPFGADTRASFAVYRKGKRGARDKVTEARRPPWRLRLTDLLGPMAREETMEPAAHMYPSDLERFGASETFAHAYSVAVGNQDERSEPLYRWAELERALADACMAAEIPDSKFESLLIALKA